MTDIRIYDSDHEKLNLAASKAGESVATIIEWLVEEHLEDLIKNVTGGRMQMSNEEAKEIVKRIKGYMGDGECWSESEFMAMDMAIQALSQEPCDDVVSRKAVLDVVEREQNKGDALSEIEKLPPVTHKSGKWINDKNDIPICSRCGYIPQYDRAIDDYEYSNYCPNCGACMKDGRTLDEFIEDSKESEE